MNNTPSSSVGFNHLLASPISKPLYGRGGVSSLRLVKRFLPIASFEKPYDVPQGCKVCALLWHCLSTLSSLRINNQAYLLPRVMAEALLNAYEASRLLALAHPCIVHDTARVAAAHGQAHVWDRCRAAAPRIARTIVLDKTVRQRNNTAAVDEAMRSTRAFWQDNPVSSDDQWDTLLANYKPALLRHCDPPNANDIMNSVVRSPDSAPGLDGLPYAAYRAAPLSASRVLARRLHDYINLQAPSSARIYS